MSNESRFIVIDGQVVEVCVCDQCPVFTPVIGIELERIVCNHPDGDGLELEFHNNDKPYFPEGCPLKYRQCEECQGTGLNPIWISGILHNQMCVNCHGKGYL